MMANCAMGAVIVSCGDRPNNTSLTKSMDLPSWKESVSKTSSTPTSVTESRPKSVATAATVATVATTATAATTVAAVAAATAATATTVTPNITVNTTTPQIVRSNKFDQPSSSTTRLANIPIGLISRQILEIKTLIGHAATAVEKGTTALESVPYLPDKLHEWDVEFVRNCSNSEEAQLVEKLGANLLYGELRPEGLTLLFGILLLSFFFFLFVVFCCF